VNDRKRGAGRGGGGDKRGNSGVHRAKVEGVKSEEEGIEGAT